jgi:diguanylate cyclase (GGDEF)-like protein
MTHATPNSPAEPAPARRAAQPVRPVPPAQIVRPARWWPLASATAVLLLAGTPALAWGLAQWLAGVAGVGAGKAAPLAAAAAAALVLLPLAWVLARLVSEVERSRLLLARLDTLDTLTGVANRSHFLALAEREWARARRYGNGAALLLIDVDRFHRLCESRGAAAGDAVLKSLARHTEPTLRGADALARFGGAQLVVWLAHADPIGALDVAERIRERIEGLDVPFDPKDLRVTVSVGVAALRPAHLSLSALIDDADAAVQAARQAGGNCVRAAPVDLGRLRKIGPSVGDNQAAGPL